MCEISIILPVYNAEKSIRFCLNSILNQTFSDFELIIIDDGSYDETSKIICNEYLGDKRVQYLRQDNRGQSEARNKGLNVIKGNYVAFIDSDDWWDLKYLEIMYGYVKNNMLDVVECDFVLRTEYRVVDEKIKSTSPVIIENKCIMRDYLSRGLKYSNSSYSVCNKLYNSSHFDNLRFGAISYSEDYLINFELFQKISRFQKISYFGYNYYRADVSTTRDSLKKEDFGILINSKKVLELSIKTGDNYLVNAAEVRFVHCYFSLYIKAIRYGCDIECENKIPMLRRKMRENIMIIMNSEVPFKRKVSLFLLSRFSLMIPIKKK